MTTWHIIECSRGQESACVALSARLGYPEGFYPQKAHDVRPRGGKRRQGKNLKVRRVHRAWVPGYIFLPSDQVDVYRLNGWHGKLWLRVLAPGGVPYKISDTDMAKMKDIPKRLKELVEDAKRQERQRWEAVRPIVGQSAIVKLEGPWEGQECFVERIENSIARILCGNMPVHVPETGLERV